MKSIDPITEKTVRRFLDLIRERYNVAGAIIYGSRARGTHDHESDADVAILLPGSRRDFWTVINDMSDVAHDIMIDTDIFISPLPVWQNEWECPSIHPNPGLLYSIEKEGIPL